MLSARQKDPPRENAATDQLPYHGLGRHLHRVVAVHRGYHRHTGVSAIRHRLYFRAVTQLIQQDIVGRQAPHRLADTHRLGIPSQDVAALQRILPGQLASLVHHRHAAMAGG